MSSTPDNVISLPVAAGLAASSEDDVFDGTFSPVEALERLRARLLDLTRQNRLLHFRHPKGRSLQFVHVDIEATFRRLVNGDNCGLLPVPEPHRTDYAPGPRPEAREWAKSHHKWNINVELAPSRGDLPTTQSSGRALHAAFYPPDLDRITRAIARDAKTAIEETGVNVLHLIFGFLEFLESDVSEKPFLAPLITLPVTLIRQAVDPRSGFYRYDIAYSGDDYSENRTLREKLSRDFHIELPVFDEDKGIEGYLETVGTLIHTRPGWRMHRQISLGLLSFAKLALWHDLDLDEWPTFGEHPVIKALFQGNTSELGDSLDEHEPQLHSSYTELIFDADVSQNRAVIDVLNGRNLVIDGPPGTGKSQTITNIIASAMAAGKTVLFVSEKLAALQVVHRRLAQARLAPFLLELHSNKAQKKQLLEDLATRMQTQFKSPTEHGSKLATFKKRHDQLHQYAKLLNAIAGNNLNKTVFDIYWAADRRRGTLGELIAHVETLELPDAPTMSPEAFAESLSTIQSLASHFDVVGDPGPTHPWFGFESERLAAGDDLRIAEQLRNHLSIASAVQSATIDLAKLVGVEGSALSRAGLLAAALALRDVPSPSDAVHEELLARLYPAGGTTGAGAAQTVTRIISALKNVHDLQNAASSCRVRPEEATPGQLQEARRAADVLHRLLGPGRTLAHARNAAASLAELNRKAESALGAWSEAARLAGISFDCTRVGVSAVCAVSHVAQAAPANLLSWRHHGMIAASARGLLSELRAKHGQLLNERAQLDEIFYLDPEPSIDALSTAISVLRRADGLFAFLRSEVRATRRFYRQLSRKPEKLTPRMCADHLARLLNYLSEHQRFDRNAEYVALLGSLFAGTSTDLDKAQQLVDWCADSQKRLAQGGNPSFDFINLPERAIVVLAETSEQTAQLANGLEAVAAKTTAYLDNTWLSVASGPSGNWRKISEEALKAAQACDSACAVLAPLGPNTSTLEALVDALEAQVALLNARTQLAGDTAAELLLGRFFAGSETDLAAVEDTWQWCQTLDQGNLPEAIRRHVIHSDMRARLVQLRQSIERLFGDWTHLASLPKALELYGHLEIEKWIGITDGGAETADHHAAAARRCLDHLDELLPWVQYLAVRKRAKSSGLGSFPPLLEEGRVPCARLPEAFEWVFYATIARSLSRTHPDLAHFSAAAHDQIRAEFCRLDASLKELNGARLAHLVAKREVPQGTAGPSPKDFSGRQLLIHEISKKKRHIAIRQLLARAGGAVQALKPCWMMSPLSVAHYLKPNSVHFDLVVMDEASQIRPEEALGAIARAAQVIVVGDPNQLPPTSFFERSLEAGDDDEGDEETGAAFSGTQSILEVANQFYPTRYLRWHYRSHHQSLIAFSNARFYDGRLIVFPSPSDRNPQLGVTYHYIEGATYSSRQNFKEAVRVVDATMEHVTLHPDESLGIATLNLTQRNLIEELLEQRVRGKDSWTAYCAKWEGLGLPFFVKNLENVQGDERDVIFVSTTFGPAPGINRVFQRFGPIGTPTGWRRLNVLFTRARIALHVYSALRPEDILVDENTRRGTAEFRNYLEYARDGKIGPVSITNREPDSDFEVAVADILRARDYEVVPQLGVAGFFIDLAVRNPHRTSEFLAAIECDGATYHSAVTVRDRDRIREQILEDLGWKGKIYRIWSTDWFRNRAHEAKKLLQFLDARVQQSKATSPSPAPVTPAIKPPASAADSKRFTAPIQKPLFVDEATDEERYVEVGDIVTYEDAAAVGKQLVVRIVDRDPDRSAGEVNENAPLARALIDLTVGDENELRIPGQPVRKVRVVRIEASKGN